MRLFSDHGLEGQINDSYRGSQEGSYKNYQMQNLPEGYIGYNGGGTHQVVETDYDRYDSDNKADETPQQSKAADVCMKADDVRSKAADD